MFVEEKKALKAILYYFIPPKKANITNKNITFAITSFFGGVCKRYEFHNVVQLGYENIK